MNDLKLFRREWKVVIHEDKTREYLNRWSGAMVWERPLFFSDYSDKVKDAKELEEERRQQYEDMPDLED